MTGTGVELGRKPRVYSRIGNDLGREWVCDLRDGRLIVGGEWDTVISAALAPDLVLLGYVVESFDRVTGRPRFQPVEPDLRSVRLPEREEQP